MSLLTKSQLKSENERNTMKTKLFRYKSKVSMWHLKKQKRNVDIRTGTGARTCTLCTISTMETFLEKKTMHVKTRKVIIAIFKDQKK